MNWDTYPSTSHPASFLNSYGSRQIERIASASSHVSPCKSQTSRSVASSGIAVWSTTSIMAPGMPFRCLSRHGKWDRTNHRAPTTACVRDSRRACPCHRRTLRRPSHGRAVRVQQTPQCRDKGCARLRTQSNCRRQGIIQMMGTIPYRAAGTFAGPSYVERDADRLLLEAIQQNQRYPYLVAPRQSGKSSLLLRARMRLDPGQYRSGFVDISTFDINNYDGFFGAVSDQIATSAKLDEVAINPTRPEKTFLAWLDCIPERLIVFVDGIHSPRRRVLRAVLQQNSFALQQTRRVAEVRAPADCPSWRSAADATHQGPPSLAFQCGSRDQTRRTHARAREQTRFSPRGLWR